MNVIGKLCLLSTVCGLMACKAESQLDLTSFDINPDNQNLAISGFVITEQNNLLSPPDEFVHIHVLSKRLIEHHWLQHPNFLGELSELKELFRETALPEATLLMATLEAAQNRYLSYLNNVDLVAKGMQREIDKDLDCYNSTIDKLNKKIHFLETPEAIYHDKIRVLTEKIKYQSTQYNQLNDTLRQSLQQVVDRHDPNIKIIDDLKFSYDDQPHDICRQYKGMSELLTTIRNNCVYINRDQLLSAFPTDLKVQASQIIDSYAPEIWQSMTQLSGYFDTSDNKQYFPDNLKYQLAQARQALREKRYISEDESAVLLSRYQQELIDIQQHRNDTIDTGLLNPYFRVDTRSDAFINQLSQVASPVQPYADVYNNADIKKSFSQAYAEKMLYQYPNELFFTVSPSGLFSIPNQDEAKRVIFSLTDNNRYFTYDMTKRSQLPHIIRSDSIHISPSTQSLVDELSSRLLQSWALNLG